MNKPPTSLVAESPTMRAVLCRAQTIATSETSVLLVGETGVGKELMAEYIHRSSPRSHGPLVKVGLSALPPELVESELFGHTRGAYTSASSEKKGLFELSHLGSIFLDDIDDFPLSLQPKLLRVLESGELMRVGGTSIVPIDVRVICATKVDLKEMVDRGLFRADLFYRIHVVPIVLPPLRERIEDIPLLVNAFLSRYLPGGDVSLTDEALQLLCRYPWPGNVRELRNVIQRISLFAHGKIQPDDLPPEFREGRPLDLLLKACHKCFLEEGMSFDEVVACLEVNLLRHAIGETHGNRTRAAKLLRMSLSTFRDKLTKYQLEVPAESELETHES
jgi:DNA-binding NtrC family response regulator